MGGARGGRLRLGPWKPRVRAKCIRNAPLRDKWNGLFHGLGLWLGLGMGHGLGMA